MTTPHKEHVRQYMWPHLDWGNGSKSTGWGVSESQRHGDTFTQTWHNAEGKQISKKVAVFRVLEADLYERDWYQSALPIAKQIWEEEGHDWNKKYVEAHERMMNGPKYVLNLGYC